MTPIVSVRAIIGMEVHVELATRTKMFTRAPSPAFAAAGEPPPNSLTDPVVLGLPGALPVMNAAAVDMAILVGLALNCRIAPFSKWDRKNYFYPDLPKAYQISQYDLPVCFDGAVDLPGCDERGNFEPAAPGARIGIVRAHLEEDAGKLLHEAPGRGAIDGSIVDWNRAGTPLLEIVTAPDLASSDQCVLFAKVLRTLCRFLGVTHGVMQRGHVRFEPNINCELTLADGRLVRTPIVEVKNLNSFTALKHAVDHEIDEQPRRWREDGRVAGPGMKTTRGWDDARGRTFLQRSKEDAHDYRYFPDPDLPPVVVDSAWVARLRERLPEPPLARMRRYADELALAGREAQALAEERGVCALYEGALEAMSLLGVPRLRAGKVAANLVLQSAAKLANERGVGAEALGLNPAAVGAAGVLRERGALNNQALDALIAALAAPAGSAEAEAGAGADADAPSALARVEALAGDLGLLTVRDDAALDRWVDEAIAANPQPAADVRAGKQAALGRLVGAVMKLSGGTADGMAARESLLRKLSP
jgi:aspartyl-tRNA(Asn)/glutamyl-tRNA(Gln) amidotransferase subunit B